MEILPFGPLSPPELNIFKSDFLFDDVPPPPATQTGPDQLTVVAFWDDGIVGRLIPELAQNLIGQIQRESEVVVTAQFQLEKQLLFELMRNHSRRLLALAFRVFLSVYNVLHYHVWLFQSVSCTIIGLSVNSTAILLILRLGTASVFYQTAASFLLLVLRVFLVRIQQLLLLF